jgi:hypothetical protein
MRLGSYTVALLASLVVFASLGSMGCGGKQKEAKVAEVDPWSGYKGTYAAGDAPSPAAATDDKPKATAEADTKADPKPGKKPKGKPGKKGAAADAKAAADKPAASDKAAASDNSPGAMYGTDTTAPSTPGPSSDDTATTTPVKKPKKKAAKKKKAAIPTQ